MREYTPERLRHLTLLAEKYPTALSAYSEIIRLEALLRLPKGTEHFMSDLHGEHEAFIHILNSASGVIREKIDRLLGDTTPPEERADLATLIYYPREKLPELKARQNDLDGWYQRVLLQLIDLCRSRQGTVLWRNHCEYAALWAGGSVHHRPVRGGEASGG